MDWLVILGAALALAIVALLGFAGCSFTPGTLADPDPPPPGILTFRLRVPAGLNVVAAGFTWTDPAMMQGEERSPAASSEPGFSIFEHSPPSPAAGSWTVTAGVRVQTGAGPVDAEASTTVMFPGDTTSWRVEFEVEGDPDVGTPLRVVFRNFVQV